MKATLLIVLLTLFTSCEKEDNIETYNELFLTHHLPLGFSFSSTPSYVVFTLDGYVHKQDLLPIDASFTTANSVKIVTGWNYITALDIYDKNDNKIATGISVYNHKKGKPAHYISKEIPINIKGSYEPNEKLNVVCFVIPVQLLKKIEQGKSVMYDDFTCNDRKDTKWIRSRLFDKNGFRKTYDYVKFVNGYGSDKPYFIVSFLGAEQNTKIFKTSKHFSNGFRVDIENSDFIIYTGKIVEIGNIKKI